MSAPPPLFNHAVKLYAAFERASLPATEQDVSVLDVPADALIYVGHWSTQFAGDPALPGESTQQKAYAFLQNSDCLEVLRRGGRDYPGVILLRRPPVAEDADGYLDGRQLYVGRLGVAEKTVAGLAKMVDDLGTRLAATDGRYDALVRDTELRLNQLDARLTQQESSCPGPLSGLPIG